MRNKQLIPLVAAVAVISAAGVALQARSSAPAQDQAKVELKLQLPKPMFIGTPRNIKTPNLEPVTGRARGPVYVPAGTVLLSLAKPVTSSDMQPVIGELSFATDGEKSGEDGYFVELGPAKQWVQVDLKASHILSAILVWHYHSQARVYRDVVIQVAEDKDFVTGVQTVFNNDHDNSSGLGAGKDKEYIETNDGRFIDPKGAKGRYVRLYSSGNTSNDMNHYVEVEVYGLPAK
ncbi:MAG: discoidin domain-containing protein [Candidatus Aminicenantes bacterium]|nr:discoidin domain-containing protein [Candidatus Aminicenantes bacterium]